MFARRLLVMAGSIAVIGGLVGVPVDAMAEGVKYLRFHADGKSSYGILDGDRVRRLSGDLFGEWAETDSTYPLNEVEILVPTKPSKVFALAGNYRDHLGDRDPPEYPQPFYKLPSCLIAHGANVVQPPDTAPVHFEAEIVIVIGKRAKNVSKEDALDYVLGITCGNDISARVWQSGDTQWWRGKASDTFGPVGPFIASGIDYANVSMELRLNGKVRQKTNSANLIHDIPTTVSFISKHCTLEPGDLIYTGTTGKTHGMYPGDVVEVEIENVGTLRNQIVGPIKYARFQVDGEARYGVVEGDVIRAISGTPFGDWKKTDTTYAHHEVQILAPTKPSKVFALAGNYLDHLGDTEPPAYPEPFIKLPSCLQRHGGPIVQPGDTDPVHYEAEVVVVIGKRAEKVSVEDALDYVLGVTCGNDVSARVWQRADTQWWRAKASDTFGPCGPYIASGIDYANLAMELRLNGEVRQKTNTKNLIHDIPTVVSFISHHTTLLPGDLIFTGTPGRTKGMKPGDIVEVELEGVGILRNPIISAENAGE